MLRNPTTGMKAANPDSVRIFFAASKRALLTIQRHPQAFPVSVDEFRHAPIRRFPFEIFYEPTDDGIIVYSVFHCSQDPQKWRTRLGYE